MIPFWCYQVSEVPNNTSWAEMKGQVIKPLKDYSDEELITLMNNVEDIPLSRAGSIALEILRRTREQVFKCKTE